MADIGKRKRGKLPVLHEELVPAPKGLRAKQFEIDGEEYAVLAFPVSPPANGSVVSLTPAEAAVVTLVLRGFSNEEISAKRSSSPRTVANQLQAIYRKLGVGSRVELVSAIGHRSTSS